MTKILFMFVIVEVVLISSTLCGKAFEWCQYKYFTEPRKWNDAVAVCRQKNKTLANILDISEIETISDFLERSVYEKAKVSNTFWIGMHRTRGNIMLQDCNTAMLYSGLHDDLQLRETNRIDGCFYIDRNKLSLYIGECSSSKQFLCKASTIDSNYRSCFKEQVLKISLCSYAYYKSTDWNVCGRECEKKSVWLTKQMEIRKIKIVYDILDTHAYPEVTATEMCDVNSKDSTLPSSNGYTTAEHGLDIRVPIHAVESYYITPALDYSMLPTEINTKPTTYHTVAHVSASWYTSVKSEIANTVEVVQSLSNMIGTQVVSITSPSNDVFGLFLTYTTNHRKIPLMSNLTIKVICNNCANPSYSWTLQKYLNMKYVNVNYFGVLNSSSLQIPTTIMKPGEKWNFHIDVIPKRREEILSKNITMFVNELPYNGKCNISPHSVEVNEEETNFTVTCSNWKDEGNRSHRNVQNDNDEGLTYEVYLMDKSGEIIKPPIVTNAVFQPSMFTLPAGYINTYSSCIVKFRVRVTDMHGDYESLLLSIKMNDPNRNITMQLLCDIEVNDTIEILKQGRELSAKLNRVELPNATLTYIVKMQPKQWVNGVLDVIDCNNTYNYIQLLENVFQDANDENLDMVSGDIEQISEFMLTSLKQFEVKAMENIKTAADAFAALVNDSIRVTAKSTKNVVEAYDILSKLFSRMTDTGSITSVQTVCSMISLKSALLNVITPDDLAGMYEVFISKDTKDSRKYIDFMTSLYKDKASDLIECSQLTPEERTGIFKLIAEVVRKQFKEKQILADEYMDQVLATHEEVISTFAKTICLGCNYTFDAEFVHSLIIKNNHSAISGHPLSLADLVLTVVIAEDVNEQEILMSVSVFDKNPYIQGESVTSSLLTSKVLKVRSENKGNNVHLNSIKVTFPMTNEISGTFYPVLIPGDASKCIYHTFMYRSAEDYICLRVIALPKVGAYEIYVRHGQYPTHLRFDYSSKISQTNDWTTCLRPAFDPGVMYICLRPVLFSDTLWTRLQHSRIPANRSVTAALTPYNLTIATASCQIWDGVEKVWRSENKRCSMTWRASEAALQCLCSDIEHELIIGNSFYVPANAISFSTVFLKFSLYNQASVLSVLVITVVLYVILCVWARYQDRKDVVKWGVTPLVDNSVDDTYYYLITVYTGLRFGAGTNTPVEFEVVGSRNETGVRKLFDGVRKEFTRGSAMNFIMSTGHPLGELDYIHMWLNPDEERRIEPWYLNRIDIEDLQQKRRYIFGCDKWLPDDTQSRSFEILMPVYGKDDILTFRNMFYYNIFENFTESHVLVSIFNRPTCSNFTRVQRVTCFFVFIIMTMISNAIYFTPNDKYEDPEQLKLGPLILSLQTVYVSMVSGAISVGTSFLISTLFRKSQPRQNEKAQESQRTHYGIFERFFSETRELEKILISKGMIYTDGMIFPFWFLYVAWILSICGSATSIFFLILFSMEWGKQMSEMWLTQFFMSFGETTVILDPIKIPIIAAIFAVIFIHIRKFRPSPFSRLLILKNYKQRYIEEKDHKDRKRGPVLSFDARKKTLTELNNQLNFVHSVRDLIFICLFIWIVSTISYGNRDNNSYLIHNSISNYLVKPSNKIHFDKIMTTADLNAWLTETAIDAIFPDTGYYGQNLHWKWRQYFSDFYSFRVGPPRLRQLRVVKELNAHPFIGRINYYGHYDIKEEATEDYCVGWQSSPCDLEKQGFSSNAWKYTSASDIWGIPIAGKYTLYGGGGYIAALDVNRDMSQRIMTGLTKSRWIDKRSRAVFLEFTLYSPTVNMFTHATFLAELPETGGVITTYTLYPFRMYQHHGRNGVLVVVSEIIFLVAVVVLIIKVVSGIYKQKCNYFKSVLKLLDFVILLTCLSCIGLYTARFVIAKETMNKFTKQPKDYLNFQHLIAVDFLFVLALSSLQALVTTRFIGNLKFLKSIEKFSYVLVRCLRDLAWFSIFFWYIMVGYAFLGTQLFGKNLHSYLNVIGTLETLFITVLGKSNFKQIERTNEILAKFYFVFFIIEQLYFLLTIFFVLLSESIASAQKMKSYQSDKLITSFKMFFKGLFNRKEIKEKDKLPLQETGISLLKEIRHCCHKELLAIQNLSRRALLKGLTNKTPKTEQTKVKRHDNKRYTSKMGTETV